MPMRSGKKVSNMKTQSKNIKVNNLARVEGEGALDIKIRNNKLQDVKLKIFEPPRFFEAFLRGRNFHEAPDITARICGICPIAYLLGASNAMEDLFGVHVDGPLRALRRLVYDGEWIESHVLHIYMLHAPDFLGYQDVIQMAKDYPDVVQKGLKMKKAGNQILEVIGGRAIHPINLRIGGFYRVPTQQELKAILDNLKWGRDAAIDTLQWTAGFTFPDFEEDYEFVALTHPDEYAIIEGRLYSNKGIDTPINQYDNHFIESHVEHSTALHTYIKGRDTAFLGPLARFNINFDKLPPLVKDLAKETGLNGQCFNPFKSIIIRSLEVIFAFDEAIHIIENYEMPDQPAIDFELRAGTGYGATEAPRGICYHRYTIDAEGTIQDAKIVSPTCVNQTTIEKDLWHFIEPHIDWPTEKLQWHCEQAIRNYDPCISCSTHYLKLNIDRA
jgi:sulfhydrogenase subunit alpha